MDEEKDIDGSEEERKPPEASDDNADGASEETPPEAADSEDASASAEAASEDDAAVAVDTPPDAADDEADPSAAAADGEQPAEGKDEEGEEAEAAMLAMLGDLPDAGPSATAEDIDFGSAEVGGAEFQQLSEPAGNTPERSIDLLMDVNLPISIELGRTQMAISDILALGPGSVVELNKLAGEPVDLLVNYKIVARGEVVVIDENFGVRVTQLLSAEERLRILGEQ
jgi:flagellar motor switch protein FliN/FliY